MQLYSVLTTQPSKDYELLDSGEGDKLERYGPVVVARPDPQALWRQHWPASVWQKASAYFSRDSQDASWKTKGSLPERWLIELGGLKFWIKLSAFKHTGVFPEQLGNWNWIRELVEDRSRAKLLPPGQSADQFAKSSRQIKVLNLFGYTGGATLAAAQAGAEVVHVDGSKVAIGWARDNAAASNLDDKPIRWILDDATKFVQRELKRGNFYDGIILDPPAFGHGPAGELWKIEEHFLPLIDLCQQLLSAQPLFFLINGYASGYSALAYKNNLENIQQKYSGHIEVGELTIAEAQSERLLPCGIFARWSTEKNLRLKIED